MTRHVTLEPRFVKAIPRQLEPGVLYVSMEYGTVVHSCCCGCGHEVVTPLTSNDWTLTFNGEHVSLWPSVGNWNLPCRSHYIIKANNVIDAGPWSDKRIQAAIQYEQERKHEYFKIRSDSADQIRMPRELQASVRPEDRPKNNSLKSKIISWLNGK